MHETGASRVFGTFGAVAEPVLVTFSAGLIGTWSVDTTTAVVGAPLAPAARLEITTGPVADDVDAAWTLRGFTSNERYVERDERAALVAVQEGLGRPAATSAALIALRKSPAWWDLTQDERRDILETRSHHIEVGLDYLPAVARRLHHSRDLGEPFDFVTWFEFAPAETEAFDELVTRLRGTEEWSYVDREVDLRLSR